MINSIFFASEEEFFTHTPTLRLGCGFTRTGHWRGGDLPRTDALALDDRYLPGREGLCQAADALSGWQGLIVCDFERPPAAGLWQLLEKLEGQNTVVPPAYCRAPHKAVLIGPYFPGRSFAGYLAEGRARFGAVMLDGAPIRHRARPGCPAAPYAGPLPEAGLPCPGAGCLYRREADGSVLFWDSRQTLLERLRQAQVPAVVLAAEWRALPQTQPL